MNKRFKTTNVGNKYIFQNMSAGKQKQKQLPKERKKNTFFYFPGSILNYHRHQLNNSFVHKPKKFLKILTHIMFF